MRYEYQIKVGEFEYIHGEVEGEPSDAVMAFNDLKRAYEGGSGVGIKKIAAIVHEYCTTGGIVNGGDNDYSANESLLLGEITKIIRKDK